MDYNASDLVFSQTFNCWSRVSYLYQCEPKLVAVSIFPSAGKRNIHFNADMLSVEEFWRLCYEKFKADFSENKNTDNGL
ncbi:hypothetical protein CHL76_12875 [Marinococcus halophilus]|uniref:Uncharacterized protein n=1 Tax=Marinococcus halophilus TaxID=1371 RepID=A0A510Y8P1_MARHA|nr:hypothetical protein [Marinococcus halophilus]OZT79450.1 hypothetical protein CHL76_12875 [Marinococcus halophilus]GEK59533.1 hypothetical protein MHA01_24380 [Marinococcus halophilus]